MLNSQDIPEELANNQVFGALPILIFADSLNSSEYSIEDVDKTIAILQGLIGSLVLGKMGVS